MMMMMIIIIINNNDNNNKSTWVNTKVTSGDSKYESNKLIHTYTKHCLLTKRSSK
jgi:hypothetical protein